MEKIEPELVLICESWLDRTPGGINMGYEILQTEFSKYQGVCIIAKKNLFRKWWSSENKWILGVQCERKEGNYFAIGAYFNEGLKRKILTQLEKLICRIRRWYENLNIILFRDFNPDKTMTISKIKNELHLKCNKQNKEIITRRQWRLGKESNSSLDYFMASSAVIEVEWLEKFESDHHPI